MPDEAEIKALLASAEAVRKRPSRGMWIAAVAVSVICVGALAWGLFNYWDEPAQDVQRRPPAERGSGFGLGLVIGIAAGIAIGVVLGMRRRDR